MEIISQVFIEYIYIFNYNIFPQGWYSEYLNPYMLTQTPEED